jgi:hypothetical protein
MLSLVSIRFLCHFWSVENDGGLQPDTDTTRRDGLSSPTYLKEYSIGGTLRIWMDSRMNGIKMKIHMLYALVLNDNSYGASSALSFLWRYVPEWCMKYIGLIWEESIKRLAKKTSWHSSLVTPCPQGPWNFSGHPVHMGHLTPMHMGSSVELSGYTVHMGSLTSVPTGPKVSLSGSHV